jgi:hypothetical protein
MWSQVILLFLQQERAEESRGIGAGEASKQEEEEEEQGEEEQKENVRFSLTPSSPQIAG